MDTEIPQQAVFPSMDPKTGMYPDWLSCRRCGKTLNAGGLFPAELYAGTYNGLCYHCTSEAGYVVEVDPLDGAQLWSYPPHEPGWRRDREIRTAYEDCPDCHGAGFSWKPKPFGRYRHHCETCSHRYCDQPLRLWHRQRLEMLQRAGQAVWDARLATMARAAYGLPKRAGKKRLEEAKRSVIDTPEAARLRTEILGRYRRLVDAAESRFEKVRAASILSAKEVDARACEIVDSATPTAR